MLYMDDFESDYLNWRASKLASRALSLHTNPVAIQNPAQLTTQELEQLRNHCRINNFAIYRLAQPSLATKENVRCMTSQIGMKALDQNLCADNDSISSLKVMNLGRARGYIPYSTSALNWHTDGYYNTFDQQIRSFLLHCVQNALNGGENMLINHELIYIFLHDQNPALTYALMQPDAFTIPANVENGKVIRPAQSGPVFYRDQATNTLQMRYTARTRSIEWKKNKDIQTAVKLIEELLKHSEHIIRYTLQPGEGLICNNILHGRSAFTNGNIPEQQRVMYRARSYYRLFSDQ